MAKDYSTSENYLHDMADDMPTGLEGPEVRDGGLLMPLKIIALRAKGEYLVYRVGEASKAVYWLTEWADGFRLVKINQSRYTAIQAEGWNFIGDMPDVTPSATVKALKADNAAKDAEIAKMRAMLSKAGLSA